MENTKLFKFENKPTSGTKSGVLKYLKQFLKLLKKNLSLLKENYLEN
jgi:hypothetical protein